MVGYRFLDDLAFSEEQKEVMSKHRDVREVAQITNVLTKKKTLKAEKMRKLWAEKVWAQ